MMLLRSAEQNDVAWRKVLTLKRNDQSPLERGNGLHVHQKGTKSDLNLKT